MSRTKRQVASWLATSIVAAGITVATVGSTASAAPAPVLPPTAESLSADGLPTVQIDGVVWSQAVVGNTVYAGGRFTNARPAGAAPGTQLTPRGNLLAYDITTGNLITSFAPNLNGQVLSVAASPDGTRIYVVGDFTTADGGQARRRVAAYSTATGQLLSWNPVGVTSQARAVVATNDTVYVGGGFQGAGTATRRNLAAFRASDGALLNWNPNADYNVWALAVSEDGSSVFAGGSFQNVGGLPAYGLAKINAATSALDTSWDPIVNNAGQDAGITSLKVRGDFVYGTTWHFGPGGNLEGTFKAPVGSDVAGGDVEWVTDCHGDVYSSFLQNGVVYVASHAHYCGNMGGGHPQHPTWRFNWAQAWTDAPGGEILNEVHGYPNWHGIKPAPSIVNWLPVLTPANFTGQGQAAWSVAGNNDYVVYGGEFPRVNGVNQQGLVRFAKRSILQPAQLQQGPRFINNQFAPTLVPTSPTSVRVSWLAGYDYDDYSLQYQVFRTGVAVARHTTTANSNWWTTPTLGFVDTGLTPGQTYTYRLVAHDSSNHVVNGANVSVAVRTMPVPTNAYANRVRADGAARIYWPMNEASGLTATDRAGVTDGRVDSNITWNQTGAIPGDNAASLLDNDSSRVYSLGTETAPDVFSAQTWIRTTTNRGGRVLGFSDLQTGASGHHDRHVYMDDAGRLWFGVRAQDNSVRAVSSARTYNDGQWHQVTATMSTGGMKLFVDGVRVGQRSDTTAGEAYLGYWRVGGDPLWGWPNTPNSHNFIGDVDEIAIYPTALTQEKIIAQYEASGRTSPIPPAPGDAYGAAVYADEPDLYWRFGELNGTTAADSGKSLNDGTYRSNGGGIGGPALGQAGVLGANGAAGFDGDNDFVSSNAAFSNPTVYSEEAWFKTSTNRGGKIIGFGCSQDNSSGCYDRHVYMQDDGRLVFGVWTGFTNTITTANSHNDGAWHHVVATQSGDGMKLYVDGELVGTNGQTSAQDYSGWWKVGGDNTWGSSSAYFNGSIDEAAVYSTALSLERVQAHFVAGGGTLNVPPTAAFTSTVNQRKVTFDGTGSSDDGSITAYAWNFGDGGTGSGANPVHVFAPGTHTVTLTVTDNRGGTDEVDHEVTVSAPPGVGDAYGAAVVADSPEFFWRFGESSGSTANDSSGALNPGSFFNGYTLGQAGALPIANTAVQFNGSNGFASSDAAYNNPTVYSEEAWFNTNSGRGGKIIGFGRVRTGDSNSYDRHVYMQDNGQLVFGTWTGQTNTITSPASYNNGAWHHVVATQSGNGMKLYVDGVLVGTNAQTGAEDYPGYWKVGGDITWGSSSNYLDGRIDEVAVYLSELSAARVAAHYLAAVGPPPANQAPVANFSSTINGLSVDFASTSTDADGTITGYAWDFDDGATSTVADPLPHGYAAAGTYDVTLTVTDDDGATNAVTKQVTVAAANQAPVANFSSTINGLSVDFASTSTDADGTITGYAWDFDDGATSTVADPLPHGYAAAGTYDVTLTVTDDDGATNAVTKQVTVAAANQAPVANFSSTINGLSVDFASTSTDADGTITGYAWDFDDGATSTVADPLPHGYAAAGTYDVTLTVTDDDGATNAVTKQVTVAAANQAPVANFSSTINGLSVDFASTSTDADGTITGYAWDFDDGATSTVADPLPHGYAAAGTYDVTLTVTDDDGATNAVTKQVTVAAANQAPVANFSSTINGLSVDFASTSTDADGTITGYAWDFDDGATSTVADPLPHGYAAAGTYDVTLTVTDDDGATNAVTKQVTVAAAPQALATDTFTRTVTNGFGTADVGGNWTPASAPTLNVANGVGTMRLATGMGPSAYLNSVSAANVDATVKVSFDKPGTGGGVYHAIVVRRIGTSDYRLKVRATATAVTLHLTRMVNGTETTLTSQTIPGMVYQAGQVLRLRLRAAGVGTTTLQGKLWLDGTAEPASWTTTTTDNTAALQNPGGVGVFSYLSGTATNGPVTASLDDLQVVAAAGP